MFDVKRKTRIMTVCVNEKKTNSQRTTILSRQNSTRETVSCEAAVLW